MASFFSNEVVEKSLREIFVRFLNTTHDFWFVSVGARRIASLPTPGVEASPKPQRWGVETTLKAAREVALIGEAREQCDLSNRLGRGDHQLSRKLETLAPQPIVRGLAKALAKHAKEVVRAQPDHTRKIRHADIVHESLRDEGTQGCEFGRRERARHPAPCGENSVLAEKVDRDAQAERPRGAAVRDAPRGHQLLDELRAEP